MWNIVEKLLQLLKDMEDTAKLGSVEAGIGIRGAWRIPERPGGLLEETSGPNNKKGNPESKDPVATLGEGH